MVGFGLLWLGTVRQGRHVWDWLVGVVLGWVILGMAGTFRHVMLRRVKVCCVVFWLSAGSAG